MLRHLLPLLSCLVLAACEPLAVSVLGAGASTALELLGIEVDNVGRFEGGELIYARCENRAIEIEVEPISPRATRVRIAAKNGGFLYDSATASEIVAQTEKILNALDHTRSKTRDREVI